MQMQPLPKKLPFELSKFFNSPDIQRDDLRQVLAGLATVCANFSVWDQKQAQNFEFKVPESRHFKGGTNLITFREPDYRSESLEVGDLQISQLQSIAQSGTFQVMSQKFGTPYTWKLHPRLIKGRKNYEEDHVRNMAYSLSMALHCPGDSHLSDIIKSSLRAVRQQLSNFAQLLVGFKAMRREEQDKDWQFERQQLIDKVRRQSPQLARLGTALFAAVTIGIDLNSKQKEQRKSHQAFMQHLRSLGEDEIQTLQQPLRSHLQYLYRLNQDLEAIREQARLAIDRARTAFQKDYCAREPIRSKIRYLYNKELEAHMLSVSTVENAEAERKRRALMLDQPAQIRFLYEISTKWRAEAIAEKQSKAVWLPCHQEVITEMLLPKWQVIRNQNQCDKFYYQIEKSRKKVIKSDHHFWILEYLLFKWLLWSKNAAIMLYFWAIRAQFGLFTLFKLQRYTVLTNINSETGQIYHTSTITPVLLRISQRLSQIKENRLAFENAPDRGFFGKKFARFVNLFQNYVLRLLIWVVVIHCVLLPVLVLVNFSVCLLLSLTSIVWMFFVILGYHLLNVFLFRTFYTCYYTYFPIVQLVIRIIFLLVKVVSCILGFVLLPTWGAAFFVWAKFILGMRRVYEFLMLTIVRKIGRSPGEDTLFAKKISGPGISKGYYSTLDQVDFVVTLLGRLQHLRYETYRTETAKLIFQPIEQIKTNLSQFFNVFNTNISFHLVERAANVLNSRLNDQVNLKMQALPNSPCQRIKFTSEDLNRFLLLTQQIVTKYIEEHGDFLFSSYKLEGKDKTQLTLIVFKDIFGQEGLQPIEDAEERIQLKAVKEGSLEAVVEALYGEYNLSASKFVHVEQYLKRKEQVFKKTIEGFIRFVQSFSRRGKYGIISSQIETQMINCDLPQLRQVYRRKEQERRKEELSVYVPVRTGRFVG